MPAFARLLTAAYLLGACSSPGEDARSQPRASSSQLPAGVAARVGRELISSTSVSRIAVSQGISPAQALALAVGDALLAEEARAWAAAGTASSIDRAARARSLLEQLAREAARQGPPAEAEIAEVVRERWADIDRPDSVRTTHAVVINDTPDRAAAAHSVAEKVAAAVKSATNSEEFQRLAKEVPLEGFELRAEALPLVTPDGRSLEHRDGVFIPRGPFDPAFSRAANALTTPGQQRAIVETSFGFHVIRLEERVAGRVVPKAELPALLGPEVLTRRAARARHDLLEKLKQGAAIEVSRAFDELTARTKAEP